jgi:hypothetical protein
MNKQEINNHRNEIITYLLDQWWNKDGKDTYVKNINGCDYRVKIAKIAIQYDSNCDGKKWVGISGDYIKNVVIDTDNEMIKIKKAVVGYPPNRW